MTEEPRPIPTSWAEGMRAKLELLKKEKEEKEEKAALERTIQDECRRLEILLTTEKDPSAAGLRRVRDVFEEKLRQSKTPDKILIPILNDPNQRKQQVDALIIAKTDQGWLVALFKPVTSVEYQVYDRLRGETQKGGETMLYKPPQTLQTHQRIYKEQKPEVQRQILFATIRAIYIRAA